MVGGDLGSTAFLFLSPPECPEWAEGRGSACGGGSRAPHGGRPPAWRSGFKRYCPSSREQRCLYGPFNTASSATDEMGKPGSDAGMPAIEDSEVGKLEENQFGE